MAKITDFEAIKLSSLSDDDVFHIIDLSGNSIVGSRKLEYKTLKDSLNQSIGLNSLLSTWTDNNYLYFKYLLKNGDEKTISIYLSSIVNIYEGDEKYLHIDDDTRKIQLNISSVAQDLTLSGFNVCVVEGNQISATDTTYSVISNGLSIDSDNRISLKIGSNLAFDAEGYLSANEGQSYSEGKAIDIDDSKKINVVLSDMISETSSNISVINDHLYVEPSTAKVTYVTWE